MPITEDQVAIAEPAPQKRKTTLLHDAQAAIRIRGEKPYEFTPIQITGESLSATILRERRGEFDSPLS